MSNDNKIAEIAEKLHLAIGKELLERVTSGEANSQELNAARQWLKDNGVIIVDRPQMPEKPVTQDLPHDDPEAQVLTPAHLRKVQ